MYMPSFQNQNTTCMPTLDSCKRKSLVQTNEDKYGTIATSLSWNLVHILERRYLYNLQEENFSHIIQTNIWHHFELDYPPKQTLSLSLFLILWDEVLHNDLKYSLGPSGWKWNGLHFGRKQLKIRKRQQNHVPSASLYHWKSAIDEQ